MSDVGMRSSRVREGLRTGGMAESGCGSADQLFLPRFEVSQVEDTNVCTMRKGRLQSMIDLTVKQPEYDEAVKEISAGVQA